MTSLPELQRAFAAALRQRRGETADAASTTPAVQPLANLEVYRNNSRWQFHDALSLAFPVLRRRVGGDYFHELATLYRERFPSRSGDLHWLGRDFAAFLDAQLAGTDYVWLADLARLEWAREQASVTEVCPALSAESLSAIAATDLERLAFRMQPSLRMGASPFPVLSVWLANQQENAPPVDQSLGAEQYMVLSRNDGLEIAPLSLPLLSYLCALRDGATLGEAVSKAGLDEAGLLTALQFMFAKGLVVELSLRNGN
jgi:putative DNA-binding protein